MGRKPRNIADAAAVTVPYVPTPREKVVLQAGRERRAKCRAAKET